jgi:hypothetical protein
MDIKEKGIEILGICSKHVVMAAHCAVNFDFARRSINAQYERSLQPDI